jgi:periplasmic copper chaperone A
MRSLLTVLALLATAALVPRALAHEATNAGVTVSHPWVRATPGGATVGAAYLEIKTADGVADTLVSASSPVAGRAELHTHIKDGDIMRMRRVDQLALVAGQSAVFGPHGNHLMLMDLKAPLKEGDLVKLTLVFAKAGPIEVEATVEPIGATGPHGMDHQPGHEKQPGHEQTGHKHGH